MHHDIATPPARSNDPRSRRTRSDRRLADPPTAEPALSDLMAAINSSRNETSSRLDDICRTQILHSSALEEVAKRTTRLEGMAKEQGDATAALAARVAELEKCGSRSGEQIPLFIDLDRSLSQRRIGWHLAQAKKVLLCFHPSLDIVLAKSEGLLTHE